MSNFLKPIPGFDYWEYMKKVTKMKDTEDKYAKCRQCGDMPAWYRGEFDEELCDGCTKGKYDGQGRW